MDDWHEAGRLTAQVREYGKKLIKDGANVLDVTEKVDKFVLDNNISLAFPIQFSVNEIAAHYAAFPNDELVFKKDDLVKLDVGVCYNGAIGDSAVSVCIGNKWDDLILASQDALNNVLKEIKEDISLGEIGKIIEDTIHAKGFNPVKNLSGHGLDLYLIHSGLNIPNYDTKDTFKLKAGMIVAIEPFATTGVGLVKDGKKSEIFRLLGKKTIRDAGSREILEYIWNGRNTLPFSKRELLKKFPEFKVNMALKQMYSAGILHDYRHLVEKSNGIVSQAEHSVLIKKDGCEILTK